MQLKIDADTFDQYQHALIRELVEQIHFRLIEVGLTGQPLREATGHVAFSVASALDNTARIESNGTAVKPHLTFVSEDEQLIHGEENSYMHEYVADLVNEVFGAAPPKD